MAFVNQPIEHRHDASLKMSPAGQLTFDVAALLRQDDSNVITGQPASLGLCALAAVDDDGPTARSVAVAEGGQFPLSFEFHSFAAASSAAPFATTGTVAPHVADAAHDVGDRACDSTTTSHPGAGVADEAYLDRSHASSDYSTDVRLPVCTAATNPGEAAATVPEMGKANVATDTAPVLPVFTTPAKAATGRTGAAKKPRAEPIRTRNVYVAGLPLGCGDDFVLRLLTPFGAVKSCRVFNSGDNVHDSGRAYAFALFETSAAALAATAGLHGLPVAGGRLSCHLSRNGIVKRPRPNVKKHLQPSASPQQEELQALPQQDGHHQPTHTAAVPVSAAAAVAGSPSWVILPNTVPPWSAQPPSYANSGWLSAASGAVSVSGQHHHHHHHHYRHHQQQQGLPQTTLPVAGTQIVQAHPAAAAAAAAVALYPGITVMMMPPSTMNGDPSSLPPRQPFIMHPAYVAAQPPTSIVARLPLHVPYVSSFVPAVGATPEGPPHQVLPSVQTF